MPFAFIMLFHNTYPLFFNLNYHLNFHSNFKGEKISLLVELYYKFNSIYIISIIVFKRNIKQYMFRIIQATKNMYSIKKSITFSYRIFKMLFFLKL